MISKILMPAKVGIQECPVFTQRRTPVFIGVAISHE